MCGFLMDNFYYKGLYRVKLLTKTEGFWIVQALEDFEDNLEGARVKVKAGEERIVQQCELHKRKVLAPPIPEHLYERQLETKVKRMVEESEQKTRTNK
jgi:hypothetical protein